MEHYPYTTYFVMVTLKCFLETTQKLGAWTENYEIIDKRKKKYFCQCSVTAFNTIRQYIILLLYKNLCSLFVIRLLYNTLCMGFKDECRHVDLSKILLKYVCV